MSDILCRICGEPWDCTGGLHHSHVDMPQHHYEQLIRGVGCPSCQGISTDASCIPDPIALRTELHCQWINSVIRCSDDTVPYEGFFDTPGPWEGREWVEDLPHWFDRLNPYDRCVMYDIGGERGTELVEEQDGNGVTRYYCRVNPLMVAVNVDGIQDADVLNVNGAEIVRRLDQLKDVTYEVRRGELLVLVVEVSAEGEITLWEKAVKCIDDALRSLEDYPCLDDSELSRIETGRRDAARDALIDEFICKQTDWFYGPASTLKLLINDLQLTEFNDHDESFKLLPSANRQLFGAVGLPGYAVLQANVNPDVWFAVPTTELVDVTVCDPIPDQLRGVVVRPGQAAAVETLPGREFWGEFHPNLKPVSKVPDVVLDAFITFFS